MSNKVIYTLGLALLLGLCYLIADLALKNFLSEERLRVMLVEPVQEQLGRQVEIGAIKVSLFSGIDLTDIVVKEKNPAREFVSIGTFRIKYELMPLFEKRLVISELLIDKPTVNIAKDPEGNFNFADLSLKPKKIVKEVPPPEQQKAEPLPITLVFNQIRVNDLNLTFTDQAGKLPTIVSTDGDLSFAVTLGKTLAETSYQGTLELVVNGQYQAQRPVLLLKGDFNNRLITFKGELNAELDKLLFSGQLADFQTTPELTLNLQGTNFNLANLLGGQPGAGKSAPQPAPPAAPPADAAQAGPKFRAHGKIEINELRHDKLAIRNLNLNYNFAASVLEISDLRAGLFEGLLSGKANLNLTRPTPAFRGQIKAEKLQMTAAMVALGKPAGYLAGELSGDFSGQSAGLAWPEIRSNIEGRARITVLKGGLDGSPLSKALAGVLAIPELENLKFDKLAATAKIAAGQAALDASLSARALTLDAKGNVGLDGSLDLPLTVKLSLENSQRLQEKAAFTRYLADPSGRTTLGLKLKGTVDQPNFILNGEGAGSQLKNALGKKAGEELNRALAKKLGGPDNQYQETTGQLLNKLLGN